MSAHTLPNLKRWSCADRELPSVDSIRNIHVYDFDNTLFKTPLPNPQLWQGSCVGTLQSDTGFHGGGWWHNLAFLAAVGEGVENEEARAWSGWWNESIVQLVQMSMEQQDSLAILVTGRAESKFAELIQRMVKAKGLEFDMVVLKPMAGLSNERFETTMKFKQAFLTKLIQTYTKAQEMKIYEDRPRHVEGFKEFCAELNMQRDPAEDEHQIDFEVIPVTAGDTYLDPLKETIEVQNLVNGHNAWVLSENAPANATGWSIKRHTLFSGYLIDPAESQRLLPIANITPELIRKEGLRIVANNVLITPRPMTDTIKEKVGGMGAKVTWKVVALGTYENKVWAARVEPVPVTARFWTESNAPHVVLARKFDARAADAGRITQWSPIPPEKHISFDSVVGEKVLLRLDVDRPYRPKSQNKGVKRPYAEDFPALPQPPQQPKHAQNNGSRYAPTGPANQHGRGGHFNISGGRGGGHRGGRGQTRGGPGGGGGGSRGKKGNQGPYRSLDDQTNRRSYGMDGALDDGGLTY